jgi:hypothetical protein
MKKKTIITVLALAIGVAYCIRELANMHDTPGKMNAPID